MVKTPMDTKVDEFYKSLLSDVTIDREESSEIKSFFSNLNPPPDKLVSIRAAAFRIGCDMLQEDNDANVSLLRCINYIVHAIEQLCLSPNEDSLGPDEIDIEEVESFYNDIFSDLSIDREESKSLYDFFHNNKISSSQLVQVRAAAFKVACDYLSESNDDNVSLLRCVNYVIHMFEKVYLKPKPYDLKIEVEPKISVDAVGLDASIEKAIQYLWDLDANRLTPNRDYSINVQKGKKPFYKGDHASDPLFTHIEKEVFRRRTYHTFMKLLDNYSAFVGQTEVVTHEEVIENNQFLDAIMETAPMQFCHKYCVANIPDIPTSKSGFKKLLYTIWFKLYRRTRDHQDSSGFEHVFLGEIKNGQVTGFHNWIQFYLEEQKGNINYLGYIKPRSRTDAVTDDDDHILTIQFTWHGVMKKLGSMFVGVSPEFEMALYTLCFLMGNETNQFCLCTGEEQFEIKVKCFTMAKNKIGTSFPEVLHHYED